MWAMLRTALTYDGFSNADGLYLTATVPIDVAGMSKDWPGLAVEGSKEYAPFGVCWISVGAVAREWDKPPPPPLDRDGRAPWSAIQLFVLRQLGRDGWEPYAYGPNTSAGWPVHLLRKRMGADHAASPAG